MKQIVDGRIDKLKTLFFKQIRGKVVDKHMVPEHVHEVEYYSSLLGTATTKKRKIPLTYIFMIRSTDSHELIKVEVNAEAYLAHGVGEYYWV
ncbi:MAG: hypothetical protein JXQ96_09230 [Cyclobacteriaceae bacterium]